MIALKSKNFRRIPPELLRKAQQLPGNFVVVECVRRTTGEEIVRGVFSHLQVSQTDNTVQVAPPFLPPPTRGKFSRKNVEGEEIVHRDQPKESRAFTIEVPNYGDWSKGSHEITWYRPVFPRSFIPPALKRMSVEVITQEGELPVWALRFRVDEALDKSADDFEDRLLFNANLLHENMGGIDVFSADAVLADYLSSIYEAVGWELLPAGEREQTVQRIISGMRNVSEEVKQKVFARYDLLVSMNPEVLVRGSGGFDRYFGAKFADDLVVFENLEYGNAVYVMFENWEALSQLSRSELRAAFRGQFERLVHSPGWENALKSIVRKRLSDLQ